MKRNWIKHPTKKELSVIVILWVTAMFLLLLSLSNLFRESVIQVKYGMVYVLMALSTLSVMRLMHNYLKSRR